MPLREYDSAASVHTMPRTRLRLWFKRRKVVGSDSLTEKLAFALSTSSVVANSPSVRPRSGGCRSDRALPKHAKGACLCDWTSRLLQRWPSACRAIDLYHSLPTQWRVEVEGINNSSIRYDFYAADANQWQLFVSRAHQEHGIHPTF